MSNKRDGLARLRRAMSELNEDPSVTHDDYLAQLPALVEAEMAGADIRRLYPELLAHLDWCAGCEAEYAALLDLALAEARGALTAPAKYPRLQLPPTVALRQLVRQMAAAILQAPTQLEDLATVVQTFFEEVDHSTTRLTLEPNSPLVMGLNDKSPAPLPRVMAIYYALETLLKRFSALELRNLTQPQLEAELQQIAQQEAQRHFMKGKAAEMFVASFVQEAMAAMPTILDVAAK